MFKNTLDNKRYHTLNYFFKNKFGKKVFKVPLDIKSPCPPSLTVSYTKYVFNLDKI